MSTAEHSRLQQSTADHSRAQQSTAEQSTAQHSAAQHSRADPAQQREEERYKGREAFDQPEDMKKCNARLQELVCDKQDFAGIWDAEKLVAGGYLNKQVRKSAVLARLHIHIKTKSLQ